MAAAAAADARSMLQAQAAFGTSCLRGLEPVLPQGKETNTQPKVPEYSAVLENVTRRIKYFSNERFRTEKEVAISSG